MSSLIARKYFLELSLRAKALKILEKKKHIIMSNLEKDLIIAERILDNIAAKHTAPVEQLLRVDSKIKMMKKEANQIKEKMIFYS